MTMSSTLKNPKRSRSRFRSRTSHARRRARVVSRACRAGGGRRTCRKNGDGDVSGKLEALKNLVPSKCRDEVVGADRIFQETADYIMVLRAQVVVLQTLIRFYGSPDLENPNVV